MVARQIRGPTLYRGTTLTAPPVVVTPPVKVPGTTPGTTAGNHGGLAATGGTPLLAGLALLLLAAGAVVRRHRANP